MFEKSPLSHSYDAVTFSRYLLFHLQQQRLIELIRKAKFPPYFFEILFWRHFFYLYF
jgi:hypothetical protein